MTHDERSHFMALEHGPVTGDEEKSVWTRIFERDDKKGELLKTMLDEEEATYKRLMEFARQVGPPAEHLAIA